MTWLTDLISSTKELEPPRNFWYWSALAAISAVMKDQVWIDRGGGYYKLYPNIYVMLFADSGLKKGPPVSLAKKLVKIVNNTRIISGRSSIQGILKELGTAYTIPGGKVVKKSVGFIAASEFTSSLVSDPVAMNILTDLYDRQYNEGEWRSLLKMESFQLTDPTLTMLVATNEAHFDDFIGQKDRHGGFMGRMFVIAEKETATLNPLIKNLKEFPSVERFAPYLKELAKLEGMFQPLEDTVAGKMYEAWYLDFYSKIKSAGIKDKSGTIQRFGDSVLKVAMLLALSRAPELVITEQAMEEAIKVCEQLIGNIRKTTMGKEGKSNFAMHKIIVIEELLKREPHSITRAQLNKKYWMHASSKEWDEVMESMGVAGLIVTENAGNQIIYRMPDEQVQYMKDYIAGRKE